MEKLRRFFNKRGIVSTSEILAGAIFAHSVQLAPVGLAKNATALALAKAPAVSGTTVTLIKGGLEMIAWTKVKTAVIASAVLLAMGTTSVIIREIRPHAMARLRFTPRRTAAAGSIKGQLFTRGQLVDAGNTLPEDAWESRYWARSQGDYDGVLAGDVPQADDTAKAWMGDKTTFPFSSRKEFATAFQEFQILARKDLSNDRVELKYQFTFTKWQQSSNPQQTKIATMVKTNGVWLCAQTRAHDASWDAGSQLEPKS